MDRDRIVALVVEDEALIRMDIVDSLLDEGFVVFDAQNADEAIALLTNNPSIQVLFTDIDMPGSLDGLKLAAAVRDRWPPIRIVVTSGHRIVDIADLPDGSMFFSKPYSHGDIATSFRRLLAET
jgi:CheY-like chemotaxis protein